MARKRRKRRGSKRHPASQEQRSTEPLSGPDAAPDEDPYAGMKSLTRRRMRLTWDLAQAGTPLGEEDSRTAEIMQEHPEYEDLWERLDELSDAEIERDGTNPVAHALIHQTVENQIANNDPPDTRLVVEALMRRGLSRHEAIHRVGSVVAEEIYKTLKEQRVHDRDSFISRLWALVDSARSD